MKRPEFDKLYDVFMLTRTEKLRLRKNKNETSWPVINMHKEQGIVVLGTPIGYERFKFKELAPHPILKAHPQENAQELADRLNRNEQYK